MSIRLIIQEKSVFCGTDRLIRQGHYFIKNVYQDMKMKGGQING